MSNRPDSNEPGSGEERDHLKGLESGAGCAEIWERLSEHRAEKQTAKQED